MLYLKKQKTKTLEILLLKVVDEIISFLYPSGKHYLPAFKR